MSCDPPAHSTWKITRLIIGQLLTCHHLATKKSHGFDDENTKRDKRTKTGKSDRSAVTLKWSRQVVVLLGPWSVCGA